MRGRKVIGAPRTFKTTRSTEVGGRLPAAIEEGVSAAEVSAAEDLEAAAGGDEACDIYGFARERMIGFAQRRKEPGRRKGVLETPLPAKEMRAMTTKTKTIQIMAG